MRKNLFWNDEQVRLLRILWASGTPASAIAKRMKVSKSCIVGKVHRLGLKLRENPVSGGFNAKVLPAKIKQLRLENHSVKEIGVKFGVCESTVRNALTRMGLTGTIVAKRRNERTIFNSAAEKQSVAREATQDIPVIRPATRKTFVAPPKAILPPQINLRAKAMPGELCCFSSETGSTALGKRWMYCDAPAVHGAYCAEHFVGLTMSRKSAREVRA